MKIKIKNIMILIIIALAISVLAQPDFITNVVFTHTETTTTVSWNTDIATNATFEYGYGSFKEILGEAYQDKKTHHEFTFNTEQREYVYKILSCTELLTPDCALREGTFTVKEFYLDLDVPEVAKSTSIEIKGKTIPETTIRVFVNGIEKKNILTKEELFTITNIALTKDTNKLKITAINIGGQELTKEFTVKVDTKPPQLEIKIEDVTTQKIIELNGYVNEPVTLIIQINKEDSDESRTKNKSVEGNFTIPIDLFEGKNEVIITAKDEAGFRTITKKEIMYDSGPPQFIETNLEELTPSYKKAVIVRGKLNEKASVTVFLNGKAEKTVLTENDGTFAAQIVLKTTGAGMTSSEMRATLQAGGGYANKIKLQAVDAVGLMTETPESIVEYAICGYGTWFESRISTPIPDILTPRLMFEGMQQIGLAFELEYKGVNKIRLRSNAIKANAMMLSPAVANQYDNGWVNINTIATPVRGYENEKVKGYIQFNFNPLDLLSDDPEALTSDRLMELSNHREGNCLVPGFGCGRFMLELEIPFQEVKKRWVTDPYSGESVEEEISENKVQKICIEQEMMIDKLIPADIIPSGALEFLSRRFGDIIKGIDFILKPIETVGKVATIGCLAGNVLMYVFQVQKTLNCELNAAASFLSGKGFNPNIAKSGMCEIYTGETQTNCKSCQDAVETYNQVKSIYQQVCDRVACPDAPTLQTYIKRQQNRISEIKNIPKNAETAKYAIDGKIYQGSDCAAWIKQNKKGVKGKLMISNDEVKKIYGNYLKHQDDGEKEKITGLSCSGIHPATAECCGYEYMDTWGSACGLSKLEFLDTFDEIKESTCLSSERVGQNKFEVGKEKVECNKLWNSVAGFCEAKGGPTPETYKIVKFSDDKIKELGLSEFSPEQMLYVFVIPLTEEQKVLMSLTKSTSLYTVKLGYVVEVLNFQKSEQSGIIAEGKRHYLNAKLEAIELEAAEADTFFTPEIIEEYYATGKIKNIEGFQKALCTAAGKGASCITKARATELYESIITKIGSEDKEYIVRPSSGLLRSGQCICLPGMVANLKLWKNILTASKNCFDVVRTTGEGSEGVCQAVLETYVCDLIFNVVKCFSEKYSMPKANKRVEIGGVENVLTALTTSASNVGRDVEERYGGTGLYKAMFVDRKLVHSMCSFAFTGTWSLDPDVLFDMSLEEVPIDSSAVIFPCSRRFIGYDPSSYPVKGSAKWLYHFGIMIAPGSDLNLRLKLKCSQGYKCKETDGFLKGECDCRQGEKELEVTPPEIAGTISKYDILNKELFIPLQGDQSMVRYDTAELSWSWTDPNGQFRDDSVTCSIGQTGTHPPNFCAFDLFTLSFRCVFGEQEGGVMFRDLTIKAPHTIKQNKKEITIFTIKDKFEAELAISQDYPSPPKPVYNKFLAWQIKDAKGRIVTQKDPASETFAGKTILNTNGDYTVSTLDAGIGNIFVTKEWMGEKTIGMRILEWDKDKETAKMSDTLSQSDIRLSFIRPGELQLFEEFKIIREEKQPYAASISYLLVIDEENGELVYRIHESKDLEDKVKNSAYGFEYTERINLDKGDYKTKIVFIDKAKNIEVVINLPAKDKIGKIKGKRKEFKIIQTIAGDICADAKTKYQPQRFTVIFQAYDADKYGNPTSMQSIDPVIGSPVEMKKEFYVVCEIPEKEIIEEATANDLLFQIRQALDPLDGYINDEKVISDNINVFLQKTDMAKIYVDITNYIEREAEPLESQVEEKLLELIDKYNALAKETEKLQADDLAKILDILTRKLQRFNEVKKNDADIKAYLKGVIDLIEDAQKEKEKVLTEAERLTGVALPPKASEGEAIAKIKEIAIDTIIAKSKSARGQLKEVLPAIQTGKYYTPADTARDHINTYFTELARAEKQITELLESVKTTSQLTEINKFMKNLATKKQIIDDLKKNILKKSSEESVKQNIQKTINEIAEIEIRAMLYVGKITYFKNTLNFLFNNIDAEKELRIKRNAGQATKNQIQKTEIKFLRELQKNYYELPQTLNDLKLNNEWKKQMNAFDMELRKCMNNYQQNCLDNLIIVKENLKTSVVLIRLEFKGEIKPAVKPSPKALNSEMKRYTQTADDAKVFILDILKNSKDYVSGQNMADNLQYLKGKIKAYKAKLSDIHHGYQLQQLNNIIAALDSITPEQTGKYRMEQYVNETLKIPAHLISKSIIEREQQVKKDLLYTEESDLALMRNVLPEEYKLWIYLADNGDLWGVLTLEENFLKVASNIGLTRFDKYQEKIDECRAYKDYVCTEELLLEMINEKYNRVNEIFNY